MRGTLSTLRTWLSRFRLCGNYVGFRKFTLTMATHMEKEIRHENETENV